MLERYFCKGKQSLVSFFFFFFFKNLLFNVLTFWHWTATYKGQQRYLLKATKYTMCIYKGLCVYVRKYLQKEFRHSAISSYHSEEVS